MGGVPSLRRAWKFPLNKGVFHDLEPALAGVTADDALAAAWYQKAADQGYPERYSDNAEDRFFGMQGKRRVSPDMTPEQIAEAEKLAAEWVPAP